MAAIDQRSAFYEGTVLDHFMALIAIRVNFCIIRERVVMEVDGDWGQKSLPAIHSSQQLRPDGGKATACSTFKFLKGTIPVKKPGIWTRSYKNRCDQKTKDQCRKGTFFLWFPCSWNAIEMDSKKQERQVLPPSLSRL